MALSPVQVVIQYPLFTPEEARRAHEAHDERPDDFAWMNAARRLAEERMRARGLALAELAAEILAAEQPPVRVSQVLLEARPGDQALRHRWMIRLLGSHLPGGYCEVPVALDLEADAARHVLAARDQLQQLLRSGIAFPRGPQ